MSDTVEISATDLAMVITDGATTTVENGIPEGAKIIGAWFIDGVVYLRFDRETGYYRLNREI